MTELDRREFLRLGALAGVALAGGTAGRAGRRGLAPMPGEPPLHRATLPPSRPHAVPSFELDEITLPELQSAMASGRYTARRLAELYLGRIDEVDRKGPAINAVIETNPDALALADQLDGERKAGRVRGPLHGVPVLIKDNIDTHDRMRTSAGSLALAESIAPRDATVAARLRAAGAVILGKTNLSEWANMRSTHSVSGWSGRGGQTRNPYALDRNPCGSSSGTGAGISANLAAIGVGTETDGSIVCPANANGLVGLKPTVGLVSRAGIIPISHTQDTAGPMGRTVADVAALLTVLAGSDPRDEATRGADAHRADYTKGLDPAALKGARLGVMRGTFGFNGHVDALMEDALRALHAAGAVLVDPVDVALDKLGGAELEVLLYDFKHDLNAYFASLGPAAPVKSMAELIDFDTRHAAQEMPYFGQELLVKAEAKGPLTEPAYRKALATCRRYARTLGIDAALRKHRLDALVAPTGGPAWLTDYANGDCSAGGSSTAAAVAGYPSVTVPAGLVFGLPVGLSFIGGAWQEAKLLRYAYAFEQATKARRKPEFRATVELGA